MSDDFKRQPVGPGRLTGALSLLCFAVSLVVGLVAAVLASERFATAGATRGGGIAACVKRGD